MTVARFTTELSISKTITIPEQDQDQKQLSTKISLISPQFKALRVLAITRLAWFCSRRSAAEEDGGMKEWERRTLLINVTYIHHQRIVNENA